MERVNLEGKWRVISLDEWQKAVEEWDEKQTQRALFWVAWGFRIQGIFIGIAATLLVVFAAG